MVKSAVIFIVTIRPFKVLIFTFRSSIHFAHHDIDAAEDYHYIGDGVTETQVLQHGEINEARRTNAITIWVRGAVADQKKPELTFWSLDPTVCFANRRTECAHLHFWIDDRAGRNLHERLFQDLHGLAHFQRSHHQAIVCVAMFSERDSEFESRIKSVSVDLANVVIHTARPQHRTRDAGVDRQFGGQIADVLCASDDN